jgi:hypothetical protein
MRKIASLLLVTVLTACGGGTTTEPPKPQIVKLSAEAIAQLPPGFTTGPNANGSPSGPFVVGPPPAPTAPQFVVGPSGTVPNPVVAGPTTPTVTFVTGPVAGPVVTVTPPIVIGPSVVPQPVINYCRDGFIVGPCTPLPTTCKPDTPGGFVTGPCTP